MSLVSALACLCLLQGATALAPPCCSSRLAISRVAARPAALCMCDAEPVAEPAAVMEDVAEDVVPEVAATVTEKATEEITAERPKRSRKGPPKTPLTELEIGAEVEGKIRSVMPYGAFVDVGAATDGLLHVSEICNEFVKDANEKLTAGETVTCKIKGINLEKNQLALTCKDEAEASSGPRGSPRGKRRPDLSEYENFDKTAFVSGTVNSITDYGAFITLKEGVDGLCHISAIQEGGVGKVEDVLAIGQEVQVRVVSFDQEKRRIGLSMKPYNENEKNEKSERPPRRSRGESFGEEDAAFKMSDAELEALTVDDGETISSFEAAFARAKLVQELKADGKKFKAQRL